MILLNSSKWIIEYYKRMTKGLESLRLTSKVFYKTFLVFIYVNKKFKQKLNIILSNILTTFFKMSKFKLKNKRLNLLDNKFIIFFSLIISSLRFFENFLNFCLNLSYCNIFFNIFLFLFQKTVIQIEIENEIKNELELEERIKLRKKLFALEKQFHCFLVHRRLFFLLQFLLLTKFTFDLVFESEKGENKFYIKKYLKFFFKDLRKFCKGWLAKGSINLKTIFFFLSQMMNLTLFFFKKIFSLIVLKNINDKFKLYLMYLTVLKYKDQFSFAIDEAPSDRNPILLDQIMYSNAFLNKWFYYRYFHNFIEKKKSSLKYLNLSYFQTNIYKLAFANQQGFIFNEKLDLYFKKLTTKNTKLTLTNFFARNFLSRDKKLRAKKLVTKKKSVFLNKNRFSSRFDNLKETRKYMRFKGFFFKYYLINYRFNFKRKRRRYTKTRYLLRRNFLFFAKKISKKKVLSHLSRYSNKRKRVYLNLYQKHWIKNYLMARQKMWEIDIAFDNENLLKSGGRVMREKMYRYFRAKKRNFVNPLKHKRPRSKMIYGKYRSEYKNNRFKKNIFMKDTHFINMFLILHMNKPRLVTSTFIFYFLWSKK